MIDIISVEMGYSFIHPDLIYEHAYYDFILTTESPIRNLVRNSNLTFFFTP